MTPADGNLYADDMRYSLFFNPKSKWLVFIILGFSFLTLSLANACMVPDWAPDAEDCCVLPCKTVSSPELAKTYCNLSDQQRSLHAGPQLPPPAILVEDGLVLIAASIKPPPALFAPQCDLNYPRKESSQDLSILHHALLI